MKGGRKNPNKAAEEQRARDFQRQDIFRRRREQSLLEATTQQEALEYDSSDDDGLQPLEANLNRIKHPEWHSDADSSLESDDDS